MSPSPISAAATAPVLVLGASGGTGLLAARVLLAEGRPLVLAARRRSFLEQEFAGTAARVVEADVTRPETLRGLFDGVGAVCCFVGATRYFTSAAPVRAVEREGTAALLAEAKAARFTGRFVYMTSIGIERGSWMASLLNAMKGRTLVWRREAEALIRASDLDYTIVRCGVLGPGPGLAERAVRLSQDELPLRLRHKISRKAAAELCVRAAAEPCAARTTFDAAWPTKSEPAAPSVEESLRSLRPDRAAVR